MESSDSLAMGNVATGILMILAFSIGTLIPLMPLGWLTDGLTELFKKTKLIKKMSGAALIIFGILLIVSHYI